MCPLTELLFIEPWVKFRFDLWFISCHLNAYVRINEFFVLTDDINLNTIAQHERSVYFCVHWPNSMGVRKLNDIKIQTKFILSDNGYVWLSTRILFKLLILLFPFHGTKWEIKYGRDYPYTPVTPTLYQWSINQNTGSIICIPSYTHTRTWYVL